MSARFVILLLIAGGLAVYFAARPKASVTAPIEEGPDQHFIGKDGETVETAREAQKLIADQAISGSKPSEPADVAVQLEVGTTGGRSRLYFNISESHGWYVDTFLLVVWRKGANVTGPEDSPLVIDVYLNEYLKANETLRTCYDVVPAELAKVGGTMGRSEDWEVQLLRYGRAREKNPDPLPRLASLPPCRD